MNDMNLAPLDLDNTITSEHIPYTVRSQITQIDPKLDVFWQDYLLSIIKSLGEHERIIIAKQILAPKHIYWNSASKSFEYLPEEEDSLNRIQIDIPNQARHFKAFVQGAIHHLKNLQEYDNVEQISDFLENFLEKIQQLNTENDFELQTLKQRLHTEFIYACASIIRNKPNLVIPQNYRGLNTHIIKTFINEIYLKQQLLGYWFRTLSNRQLADMPYELMNDYLRREQKVRQLEVIMTSRYIFAIAPCIEAHRNPFAIRRFLKEETLFSQNRVIFNGVALNPAMLQHQSEANIEYQERFKQQIQHIITLDSNIGTEVFDLLEEIEYFHDNKLLPLLFTSFPVDIPLTKAVLARLQKYEKLLIENILKPLFQALRHNLGNQDEYDVFYVGVRQIFGNILSTFKEFLALPALLLNEHADLLFGRLVGYTLFLKKRRQHLFVVQTPEEWEYRNSKNQIEAPLHHIQTILQQNIDQHRNLVKEINSQQSIVEATPSLMDRLLKRKQRENEKLNGLKRRSHQAQLQVYQEILQLPHNYPEQVVHLEFDSPLITNQNRRHYAFPAGTNGLTQLPFLITLPSNGLNFNLSSFANELTQKINSCV